MLEKRLKAICAFCLVVSLVIARSAMATPYTQIIVFGDTLSDVGNFYRASQFLVPYSRFYSTNQRVGIGRFSNNTLWVEQLAGLYNPSASYPLLPNTPSGLLPTGTDYAWADATIDSNVSVTVQNTFVVPSIHNQVLQYLSDVKNKADPNALYVVWAGMTDLINGVENGHSAATIPTASLAQHLVNIVGLLKAAGAQNFNIPTVPDIAYLPEITQNNLTSNAEHVSSNFNSAVTEDLVSLSGTKGITLNRPDIYYLQRSILQASNHLNFTDVTDSCIPSGFDETGQAAVEPCPASVQPGYLYWDGRNFAAFANSLFATSVITATPSIRTIPFE